MKAIIVSENGGSEKLKYTEFDSPRTKHPLSDHSVVIKTAFAGVNFIDVYIREGVYPSSIFPFIPGKEGIGTVVEVGSKVTHFAVGDTALLLMGGGAYGSYAEEIVADEKQIVKVPKEIDPKIALAAGLQGFTAHYLVNDSYPIQSGDIVLIHAGAGGVGHLLIQMAKAKGARVITTVSTDEKKAKALDHGADEVILYHHYQFEAEVMKLTEGRGVHAVYDSVGQATFDQSLKVIKTRGTMVSYGQSSGMVPPFQINRLNTEGGLFLTRPSLAHHILTREEIDGRGKDIFDALQSLSGKLKVEVGNTYPLEKAAQAHDDLEARKTTGKLILSI